MISVVSIRGAPSGRSRSGGGENPGNIARVLGTRGGLPFKHKTQLYLNEKQHVHGEVTYTAFLFIL